MPETHGCRLVPTLNTVIIAHFVYLLQKYTCISTMSTVLGAFLHLSAINVFTGGFKYEPSTPSEDPAGTV